MKPTDPIRLARLYGAKIDQRSNGKWICLDMKDTPLWTLTFDSVLNAARAYLIVGGFHVTELATNYRRGYEVGKGWDRDYRPGGPFKWRAASYEPMRVKLMGLATIACHAEWMRGFDEGFKKKICQVQEKA